MKSMFTQRFIFIFRPPLQSDSSVSVKLQMYKSLSILVFLSIYLCFRGFWIQKNKNYFFQKFTKIL